MPDRLLSAIHAQSPSRIAREYVIPFAHGNAAQRLCEVHDLQHGFAKAIAFYRFTNGACLAHRRPCFVFFTRRFFVFAASCFINASWVNARAWLCTEADTCPFSSCVRSPSVRWSQ